MPPRLLSEFSMSLRALVVSASFFVSAAIATPAMAQSSPRQTLAVAGQTTLLRPSDAATTSIGVGGRITWDFLPWASTDVEAAFFPRDTFEVHSRGLNGETLRLAYHRRRSDVFAGVRAGVSGNRFGLFGKVRPGFTRLQDKGLQCVGSPCALALFLRPEYKTEFALDLGGIVEFYPTRRTVARFDLGDEMIRHASFAVPPCPDCTTHNLTSRFGVGLKF